LTSSYTDISISTRNLKTRHISPEGDCPLDVGHLHCDTDPPFGTNDCCIPLLADTLNAFEKESLSVTGFYNDRLNVIASIRRMADDVPHTTDATVGET